tara:strand:+ start:2956 stop:3489 length:534 start_codon:yes stop_codon:yes gene_type:complete
MSQVGKINYVNSKLGATMSGQQTTRYIYDSVVTVAGQTQFDFFQTFAGKTDLQTNLTTNKLDSSESMVIKSIYLNGDITAGLTGMSNLNITVGNQVVLKDFNLAFNATNRGVAYDRLHSGFNDGQSVEIRLLTDIVIPPQVNFRATLQLAENTTLVDQSLTIGLKGYGVIFSAGNTF